MRGIKYLPKYLGSFFPYYHCFKFDMAHSDQDETSIAQHACTVCSRRKVKCDKQRPKCSKCVKNSAECRYETPPPPQRHRKRRAEGELLDRISQLEHLVQRQCIDIDAGRKSTWADVDSKREDELGTSVDQVPETVAVKPSSSASRTAGKSCDATTIPAGKAPIESSGQGSRNNLSIELRTVALQNPSFLIKKRNSLDESTSWLPISSPSNICALHPPPRHIFKLWQIFAENVDPLTKILHTPTVQQRILDTSWDLDVCTKPFHALLFSIYLLAIVSLSPGDCQKYFGETRPTLLERYKTGAWQALMAARLFETRDLEVLQAFVLFIVSHRFSSQVGSVAGQLISDLQISDPNSEASTTLSAVAARLALKMGLDSEDSSDDVSFFEREMRIRLWWQICIHEVLARHLFASRETVGDGLFSVKVRLPLNVNDAELHPDMLRHPVEHAGATEMVYVLVKYEGSLWAQRQRARSRMNREEEPVSVTPLPPATMASHLNELEKRLEHKYLRYCDPSIPLHLAAQTLALLFLCRPRYRISRVMAASEGTSSSPLEEDALFDQAVKMIDLDKKSRLTPFATLLLRDTGTAQLDSVIHLIVNIHQHKAKEPGDQRVARAWDMILLFWNVHVDDSDLKDAAAENHAFFAALADLTLEAWQVRWHELASSQVTTSADDLTPACVRRLQQVRDARSQAVPTWTTGAQTPFDEMADLSAQWQPEVSGAYMDDIFWFGNDDPYDFGYAGDILQM
jgi:hypothetical protein